MAKGKYGEGDVKCADATTAVDLGGVLVLAVVATGVYLTTRPRLESVLGTSERRAWRDQAIATINARVADPKWLESELEKAQAGDRVNAAVMGWEMGG